MRLYETGDRMESDFCEDGLTSFMPSNSFLRSTFRHRSFDTRRVIQAIERNEICLKTMNNDQVST